MAFKNFDLSRLSGLFGLYFLGSTFALFIARMIISMSGNSWMGTGTAVTLFETAFYITIAGCVTLIIGIVLLYLNSQTAEMENIPDNPTIRNSVMILFAITIISIAISVIGGAMLEI